jgi:hypothetical protein
LEELRSIGARVSVEAHARMLELDRSYQDRCSQFDQKLADRQKELEAEADRDREKLKARSDALDQRAADLDLSDSKAARRKLRQELRETLKRHSERFELSQSTRRQRWPVAALLVVIMLASGYLTYSAFADFSSILGRSESTWLQIVTASLKQLFFAVSFLGFATYTLRWLDGWSRRHSDAEFHFKQLELDIDRASWVVEVALEWRQQQGAELPQELLNQLSSRLFSEREADAHSSAESIGSLILGAASNLKLKAPGVDLEVDRKGLRKMAKED